MKIQHTEKRGDELVTKVIYESQPRQTAFHEDTADCRMYGGAAGGGKSEAILWELFAICNDERYKKLKGAVFRKTFPELDKFFIQRALDKFPSRLYHYSKKDHVMTFKATKSQIQFSYCESDADVNIYQGAEWDYLAIDEFTQHTEYVFKYLFHRLRTDKPGWRPKFFGGTNPGGIGHNWVKRIWVDGELDDREKKFTWSFIPAKLEDNPKMLENNPDYEDRLELIPDAMIRKAMRHGDWNIFAGQFFDNIRKDVHGFDPYDIPKEWSRFAMLDYGYDHPSAVYWGAVDEDGEVWLYKELVCRGKTYREVAQLILEQTDEDEKLEYLVADPSIWAKKGSGDGLSGAEEMQEELDSRKIVMIKADNDRANGWGVVREWMKIFKKQEKDHSRLHISNALTRWWKMVPSCQRDPKRPEDMLKQDDDEADSMRYGLMSRPRPAKKKPPEQKVDRYGMPEKKPQRVGLSIQGRPKWDPIVKPEWKGNK